MKTVILCGGMGLRLSGETEFKPKPLVEIGDKPILWHIMKGYEHQGFKDFILCLGYKGNVIKEYFLNIKEMSNSFSLDLKTGKTEIFRKDDDLEGRVVFADTGLNSMTGSRVAKIKQYIDLDNDFFLTYGDGVSDINLNELYKYHKKRGKIGTITVVKPAFYKFGLVEMEDGLVTRFDEKPSKKEIDKGGLINGGFMVFNKKFFEYLSTNEQCTLEQEPLKNLVKDEQLASYYYPGYWQCADNRQEVNILNDQYKGSAPWMIWRK